MALNLSTLTDPSTSAGILTDLAKSASNLDLVASLENQVSGGANATQTTATRQPRAHVPIGDGHLYIPNVSGNYAEGPSVTIGANETWEGELDMVVTQWGSYIRPMGGVSGGWQTGFGLIFYSNGLVRVFSGGSATNSVSYGVALGTPFNIKYGYDGSDIYIDVNDSRIATSPTSFNAITETLQLAQQNSLTSAGEFSIQKAKLTVGSSVVFDCDFSASNIGHGDTSFQAAVGGTVTINTSGNDPATIVRRPFLRLDGASSFLTGSFNESNTTGGYMFVVYSVNGDGGGSSGRVFVMNSAGEAGYNNVRSFLWSLRKSGDNNIAYYHNQSFQGIHTLGFDPADGVLLHEVKAVDGSQFSKVNNGDIQTSSLNLSSLSSEEFDIGSTPYGTGSYPAIDIEALYLFDHTLTDDDATKVRDYLNAKSSIY
ncbi:hypothetical protein OAG69_00155 [bacterium]|nr:hypothetical protein [bacterium]